MKTYQAYGIICPNPNCRAPNDMKPVEYTRHRQGRIMRVRHCRVCGRRIVTWEGTEYIKPTEASDGNE